jgi:DNA-binding CsgD family transcriptional regulator
MDERTFSRILDAIYDAATSFDHWTVALDRIGRAFGASYVGLIDRNLRTLEGRAIAVGIDPQGQREYFETWSSRDLLRQWTRTYRPGAVETDQDILPRAVLVRSDYYNCFMKPRDMHTLMRITLTAESGFRKFISFNRPLSLGDYGTTEVEECRRLLPHLQRAARVAQSVEDSLLALNSFSAVLEQSAKGVLLLDRTGKVVFANRALRAMTEAGDGLCLRRECLEAVNGDDNAALQRLIAGATRRLDRADVARGGVMRVSRRSGKPGLSVAVSPMGGGTSWSGHAPVAFIMVTDPSTQLLPPDEMMEQLFGLTPAETRVAMRLMAGESPERVAEMLDVSITTVRWHLASLYRKTGTSRQAELMRQLLLAPTA